MNGNGIVINNLNDMVKVFLCIGAAWGFGDMIGTTFDCIKESVKKRTANKKREG